MMWRALATGLLLVLTAGSDADAQDRIAGVASVIDGDTIEIHGTRIRLHGIDAPESAQQCLDAAGKQWRCGQKASLALADRIGGAPVTCRRTDTDQYGRGVAICHKDTADLNAWMVEEGWAVAYQRYSRDYVALEEQARAAGKGIWSSRFVMPWDWRRGQRIVDTPPQSQARPEGCDIKGNINARSERIYHVPGGRWYEQTKIDESRAERWFCSEEEAWAAGWRRSRQ
ncbi:MAG: thermonuclease family protein [Hyphomicrobiales bacterium]|nr:MAG: thermonuclease family protein [Hyphomicrobiales bacterium]